MKLFLRILPILILTSIVILFFLPLFWPVPQIFVTPDSQISDILHLNYPLKYLLSESLKQNQLPLWTDLVGTGFPLIGEGQIQAFSIINLILFKLFPLITAFNLQYVVIFLGFAIGMYLVSREFGWSRLTAIFCAIIYSFSGLHIVKIPHLNCLQALSYVPFIFWIILRMQKNKRTKLWLVLPFLCSQQILQGHYQYIFMTYVFLGMYFYFSWWNTQKQDRVWITKKILLIGFLTSGLSMGQLLPSFEYFLKSGGREILGIMPLGSFQISHLLQFFYPYALGDNRIGTYPVSYGLGFHETFLYIGLIPLLLTLSSLLYIRQDVWVRIIWIVIGILMLLVFENNSPLYMLFSFPPFSWFHVYSRFLAFVTFLFVLLSGFVCEKIVNSTFMGKKLWNRASLSYFIIFFLFCVSFFDIFSFAFSYNPKLPQKNISSVPYLFQDIPKEYRTTSTPYVNKPWFEYMYSYGWKNPYDYLYLLNGGQPNYGILHEITNFSLYTGFLTKKQLQVLSLSLNTSAWDDETKAASLSASAVNTLRLHNTKYLISSLTLTNDEVALIDQVNPIKDSLPFYYLYELSGVKPKYYLTDAYKQVQFVEDFYKEVAKRDALSRYDAFITTNRMPILSTKIGVVTLISDGETNKQFSLSAPTDMFFVASVYRYPGWKILLDGKMVDSVPSNLSGMAVFIPEGYHTLTLTFFPKSLYVGIGISIIAMIVYGFIIIRSVVRK